MAFKSFVFYVLSVGIEYSIQLNENEVNLLKQMTLFLYVTPSIMEAARRRESEDYYRIGEEVALELSLNSGYLSEATSFYFSDGVLQMEYDKRVNEPTLDIFRRGPIVGLNPIQQGIHKNKQLAIPAKSIYVWPDSTSKLMAEAMYFGCEKISTRAASSRLNISTYSAKKLVDGLLGILSLEVATTYFEKGGSFKRGVRHSYYLPKSNILPVVRALGTDKIFRKSIDEEELPVLRAIYNMEKSSVESDGRWSGGKPGYYSWRISKILTIPDKVVLRKMENLEGILARRSEYLGGGKRRYRYFLSESRILLAEKILADNDASFDKERTLSACLQELKERARKPRKRTLQTKITNWFERRGIFPTKLSDWF